MVYGVNKEDKMRLSKLDLIVIQAEVLFVHNQVGKMKYVNEQGNPKAPRFSWQNS